MPVDPSKIATWANLVTVGRMFVSPIMFIVIPNDRAGSWFAFATWFVLCCSDGIDGYLARRHGSTTFGTFLDPLADKFLILLAMVTLIDRHVFWWLPVVIIFTREVTMSLYRIVVSARGISVPASKIAKWKTFAQQLAVGFAIMPRVALEGKWLWNGLLWLSVGLAMISFCQYMWRAHRHNEAERVLSAS
jgi:CDP-diacylglycerol---glycerol-3-phosphate 3-phosphatidyltransferase